MIRPVVLAVSLLATVAVIEARQPTAPCERVDSGPHLLTVAMKEALASRFRSWEIRKQCLSDVGPNSDLDPKALSVTSGDYDDDGSKDYAVLLEWKTPVVRRGSAVIVVAFLSSAGGAPVFAGDGSLFVTSNAKGDLGHNWDIEQDFTFPRDAIFTGDFHCCGHSLLFVKGRFIRITTSD